MTACTHDRTQRPPASIVADVTIADAPTNWPDPPPMSMLEGLLLFAGLPLLAMAVITAMVLVPSLAKGARSQPTQSGGSRSEWFGAPDEVESGASPGGARKQIPGSTSAAPGNPTGGASARW